MEGLHSKTVNDDNTTQRAQSLPVSDRVTVSNTQCPSAHKTTQDYSGTANYHIY